MEPAPDTSLTSRRAAAGSLLKLAALSAVTAGTAVWLRSRSRRPEEPAGLVMERDHSVPPDPSRPELAVISGGEPATLVQRAFEELGGVRRFISPGDVVVVKPNVAWDRTPQQAANTNPEVVAEVARLCLAAGAKRVLVTDVPVNEARRCFYRSGIATAATQAGAQVMLPEERHFRQVDLRGEVLRLWPVLRTFIEADKIINIPVAKHHSLTRVSLGLKNWYGILGGSRHRLHQQIHESLADLADFMRPTLTLLDAWRVLLRNGPTGGSLGDVIEKRTLIASTDAVAADAWAARQFWGIDPQSLPFLALAQQRGLGRLDLARVRSIEVNL